MLQKSTNATSKNRTKLSKSNPSNEFIGHTSSQVQLQPHQLEFVKHKENGHENSLTINVL